MLARQLEKVVDKRELNSAIIDSDYEKLMIRLLRTRNTVL